MKRRVLPMIAGLALVVVVLLLAIPFLFHMWALIEVLRTPEAAWARTGQSQILWGVVVLFLSLLGPILYMAIARPRLRAVGETKSDKSVSGSATQLLVALALLAVVAATFTVFVVLLMRGGATENTQTVTAAAGRSCITRSTAGDGFEVCIIQAGRDVSIAARGLLPNSTLTIRGIEGGVVTFDTGPGGALQAQLEGELVESFLTVEGTWADGEGLALGVEHG